MQRPSVEHFVFASIVTLSVGFGSSAAVASQLFDSTYNVASGRFPDEGCIGWDAFGNPNTLPIISDDALVLATTSDADNIGYRRDAPHVGTPDLLIIEFRMKYVSGSSVFSGRTTAAVGATMGAENRRSVLYIDDGSIFLLESDSIEGPRADVVTSDDFHDYRFLLDSTNGEVDVYYDGTLVLEGATYPETQATGPRLHWGDGTVYAHGESRWISFRHNASTHPPINLVCGDPIADAPKQPDGLANMTTAGDALLALRASVGSECCELCVCDVDDSGSVTATDALSILKVAIGAGPVLACPACS